VVDLTTATRVAQVETVTSAEEILDFQQLVRMVPIGESLAEYVVNLVRATRHNSGSAPGLRKKNNVNYGGSVRAAQFIVLASKARALTHRRYHVTYEDIAALTIPVLRHRILLNSTQNRIALIRMKYCDGCSNICRRVKGLRKQSAATIPRPVRARRNFRFGFSGEDRRGWLRRRTTSLARFRIQSGIRRIPRLFPGDDLRHVDWNVFARTERAYLKRYRGETNSILTVLLDASNSMSSRLTPSVKWITPASRRPLFFIWPSRISATPRA